MHAFITWLNAYPYNNFPDYTQSLLFAGIIVWIFFRQEKTSVKVKNFLLSFLLSFNTANIFAALINSLINSSFPNKGLSSFFVASFALLLTVIPIGELFRNFVGKRKTVFLFIYAQFFVSNCLGMIIAYTVFQRFLITIILSIAILLGFRQEIRYMAQEKTMLSTDRRFIFSTIFFMALMTAEAEMPRIVLDGSKDGAVNSLAIGVSIVGIFLTVMYNVIMKFSFYSISTYETYLREHYNDVITPAKNLSYLSDHAVELVEYYERKGVQAVVFYTDILNFRDINILHGYEAGSHVLKLIAEKLMAAFPDGIIIRMSSDHFAGIVPLDGAIERFDQIRKDVEDLSLDETLLLNIGVYQLSHNFTTDPSKYLMRSIDLAATAMRHIPQGSKEHIQMFNEDLEKAEKIRTHVLSSVDQAVTEGWHDVYYQPLIDIKSGKLAEFEALSRWIDPIYGFLTPDQFIVPLEDSRLVYKMDLNVLRSFAKDAQVQLSQGQKVYPISFNISRTDLEASINIYEEIEKIVHDYHLSKDLVHIEITESALNDSSEKMKEALHHFHELGYEVWMDDFGSGYSSLNVLKDYHFDVLKIDMVFLRHFDERSQTIIASICEMANHLGIRTVAEGVETQQQFDFLKRVGCTYAQGYLFSKPLPFDETTIKMQSLM